MGRVRVAVRRIGPYLAVAAALVVLLAGLGALGPDGSQVVRPGAGVPSAFDPYATGIGVVDAPSQPLVVLVVAAATAFAFYGAGLLGGRKGGLLALLFVVVPGAFLASQVLPPPLAPFGAHTTDGSGTAPDRLDLFGYPGAVVTAEPSEPYWVALVVVNRAPVPIRLDGIVPSAPPDMSDAPSLWLETVTPDEIESPDTPFQPVILAPGESLSLWLVQRANPCAAPFKAATAVVSQGAIALRWSVLGLVPRVDGVELPFLIDTPTDPACTAP